MKLDDRRIYFRLVLAIIVIGGMVALLLASTPGETKAGGEPAPLTSGREIGVRAEDGDQLDLALLADQSEESITLPAKVGHVGQEDACQKQKYSWQQVCVQNWGRAWGG